MHQDTPKGKDAESLPQFQAIHASRVDRVDDQMFDIYKDRILYPSFDEIRKSIRQFPIGRSKMPFHYHGDRFDTKDENQQSSSGISKKFLRFSSWNYTNIEQHKNSDGCYGHDVFHKKHKKIFYLSNKRCIHIYVYYSGKTHLLLAANAAKLCSPTRVVPSLKSHVGIEATLAHMVGATIQSV